MEFEAPPPMCRGRFKVLALRTFHKLMDGVSSAFGTVFPSSQASSRPFDAGKPSNGDTRSQVPSLDSTVGLTSPSTLDAPRLFRYALDPAAKPARLTSLRLHMADVWVRLILDGDY